MRALVEVDEPEEEAEVAGISFDFEDESAMMSPASKFVCKSKLRAGYVHLELTDPTNPET